MSFTAWNTAHGEAQPAFLQCRAVTALAPMDDSVDTNTVVIEGAGVIVSFGECRNYVLKRVKFVPLVTADRAPGAAITLENSVRLNLLSGQRRSINDVAYGMYHCDGENNWNEVYFVQQGAATVADLEQRLAELEQKIARLERTT